MISTSNSLDANLLSPEEEQTIAQFPSDAGDFVSLSEVCFNILNEQTQYVSRHLLEGFDVPMLAEDLRIEGEDEYDLMIHKDDISTFVSRLREYRRTY